MTDEYKVISDEEIRKLNREMEESCRSRLSEMVLLMGKEWVLEELEKTE
jgi:hypothetical protein